jgi:uncharacterized protein (TIGR02117 family)
LCACAGPVAESPLHTKGEDSRSIWVVNYGWHSSIVIKKADIRQAVLPEVGDFPDADHVEIGWGDWDFYQARDPGVGLAFKAAFWSSKSVLHVTGFKGAPTNYFRASEIVEIVLSDDAFRLLIQFISDSFSRPRAPARVEGLPGLFPNSRFYPATGRFYLFQNCNTWVAEALQAAKLPINPTYAFTATNLSYQIRKFVSGRRDPA